MTRELDAKVAEAMGCKVEWRTVQTLTGKINGPCCACSYRAYAEMPPHSNGGTGIITRYSTDIAAAWQVVEWWLGARPAEYSMSNRYGHWIVRFSKRDILTFADAPTAPLAICLAFLKAMGVEVEDEV